MEADFSGYATKAGLKCSDGRTIMPDAFKHQDQVQVPLVWQHGHKDPENVLGHAILENREDGVYAYCFFNGSQKASHARELVEHKDINMMSIWANDLIERSKRVIHGVIREVSLVLSGANPGALIEQISIRHSDDPNDFSVLDDEAIIYTGLEIEHGDIDEDLEELEDEDLELTHADGDKTVQDVYDEMTDEQKNVLHYMVGEALESAKSDKGDLKQDNLGTQDDETKGSNEMNEARHNVFEGGKDTTPAYVLSHDDMNSIVAAATKGGSLKEAVEAFAEEHLEHGIQDIDILFPEARAVDGAVPELFGRRVEWVANLMAGVKKSPFTRIKTLSADITVQEARAKGYIKGNLKKEEFFRVSRRVTTPQTVYKKQKLDRDDILDITDFDVVVWLKAEMRVMLDEEIARAILVGDGRDPADEDKINEDNIRPVATDHELYTTVVNVEFDDTNVAAQNISDAFVKNRYLMRGSGLPTMYTSESIIARFLLLRDQVGREKYTSLDQLATVLRVKEIVPVEILEEYPEIVAVIFNPNDYVVGADRGGQVSMFDDFDIDYNQHKYLIETRVSGALTKLKAALVIKRVPSAQALVTPTPPTFDGEAVTIIDTANVVYRNAETDAVIDAAGSPYAVAEGESLTVQAEPAAGYYFETSDDSWTFTNNA